MEGLSALVEGASVESGEHKTVLLKEAISALVIKPDGCYVDGTFGRGGHTQEILKRISAKGRLFAFDRDVEAINVAKCLICDSRFWIAQSVFSKMGEQLSAMGVHSVDGILLDLGVSSPQLNTAERGFSFQLNGPLDMRMDQSEVETVADFLTTVDELTLREVIKNYGEERFAGKIARKIIEARRTRTINTTLDLAQIIFGTIGKVSGNKSSATRTFQALRIHINKELEELSSVLARSVDLLTCGGRLAVISFHSLEDRIVKQFFQKMSHVDSFLLQLPIRDSDLPNVKLKIVGKPIKPSSDEVRGNPRSRSAILRIAERI